MSEKDVLVHIDLSEIDPNLPGFDENGKSACCHAETEMGFGLAGGGYGPYSYCTKCSRVLEKTECTE